MLEPSLGKAFTGEVKDKTLTLAMSNLGKVYALTF